jgi:hypothetical protein
MHFAMMSGRPLAWEVSALRLHGERSAVNYEHQRPEDDEDYEVAWAVFFRSFGAPHLIVPSWVANGGALNADDSLRG